jgi:hypothetical protein
MPDLVNKIASGMSLKYKHYIGLARDGAVDNFMAFRPRCEYVIDDFRIPRSDEVTVMLNDSGADGLEYDGPNKAKSCRVRPGCAFRRRPMREPSGKGNT